VTQTILSHLGEEKVPIRGPTSESALRVRASDNYTSDTDMAEQPSEGQVNQHADQDSGSTVVLDEPRVRVPYELRQTEGPTECDSYELRGSHSAMALRSSQIRHPSEAILRLLFC
jgi:hypothetical protein